MHCSSEIASTDENDSDEAPGEPGTDEPDNLRAEVQRSQGSLPMTYRRLVPNIPLEGETISTARMPKQVGLPSFLRESIGSGDVRQGFDSSSSRTPPVHWQPVLAVRQAVVPMARRRVVTCVTSHESLNTAPAVSNKNTR